MTKLFLFLEGLTESPYTAWGVAIYAGLAVLLAILIICAGLEVGHRRQRRKPIVLRQVPNEQQIHDAVNRLRPWSASASKGFRPGFTADDRVVEDETARRRELSNLVQLSDRRVH